LTPHSEAREIRVLPGDYSLSRSDIVMNRKFIVAILLLIAVPVYAHAQNPRVSKGDAQKVVTIISGDKAKTQTYCAIKKLGEQIEEASANKDGKTVNELSEKIETLEKTLGPEYLALLNGLQDIVENDLLGAEFTHALASLDGLCTR
jgi:prephenate dehydratase